MPDRGRERKRRRRRSDDDDEEDGGFTGWKLGLVVGVIVVCFAMLYPTVIHPMLMGFMGRKEPQRPTPTRPPVHPGMGGPGMPRPGGGRSDIHPAMRMAQQQAETQSGGRGMFTWMLPIYTVGVVIFLLYTLFKTKSKKKRRRYDSSEYSSDEGDEYNDRLKRKIGKRKLRGLQERLQQTEEAMNKILEQLEAVQAAGALAEGTQDQTEAQASEGKENSEPKAALNSKNDQYINDLEKALRDFKVLSDAYEEERGLRRKNSGTEDDTSTEELDSGSDEEDSEEEELPKEKKKRSAKAREDDSGEDVRQREKKKTQKKKRRDESDEEEDEAEAAEETAEPSEEAVAEKATKNVRRRARKV